jgi:hypothetical protein
MTQCKKCKDQGYYFPDKNSDVVVPCECREKVSNEVQD